MAVSASQIPLSLTSHNNQSLFSDHYLDDILRRTDAWRDAIPQAQKFLEWLRALYAQEKAQLPVYNENQLEDKWFKPIFAQLGHANWEGQAVIPGWKGGIKKPDFFFFADDEARKTAVSKQNSNEYAEFALAVAEVKQWEINLSKKSGRQPIFADQNPMYQIDTYLSLTGLEWGILSNGRFWRLLHKNSSRTLETYFEIDLLAALEQPDETSATAVATYFWLFFNQASFLPAKNGRIFLDTALEQSRAYALALEADLRDNAYRALEHLILGFFAANPDLDANVEEQRNRVYRNSLYLLYRLLFLFYGESRALLPMHNITYKENYSLQRLAQAIHRERSGMDTLPATARRHWNRLSELFRLISGSDPLLNADLGVPRYNGGLFDPQQHPFLENHVIGDRYLARAIDYLAYRRVREDGRFLGFQAVDYRTLDVRQLGSVYEGLLEYRVAVASEALVTVRKKGVETWVTASSRGKAKPLDHRPAGELYLATDKGERKATGSYYTPDYIVEYIVENTLGPLVEGARARVKAQIKQLNLRDADTRQQKSAALFEAEILRLNVLDPAMGSGHFLVEATNYLARALATDEYAAGSTSDETDLLYWKRRVVEACIYGVDKNPMAVELAKLSLWLKTAAADKPLSFLDHHLQHGDSLIGAWLKDLTQAPTTAKKKSTAKQTDDSAQQQPLFDDSAFTRDINRAVADVMLIESLPTLDIETVYAKEKTWQAIQDNYVVRWRQLADLWVSHYFGNTMTPEEYRALADRLQGRDSLLSATQAEEFLNHPAVTDNDYFHWELAFPEVFFDEYGRSLNANAGFDTVFGNPPYVRIQRLPQSAAKYYLDKYKACSKKTDLSVAFLERGFDLLNNENAAAFISSSQWMSTDYGQDTRRYFSDGKLSKIVDFGSLPIFENVSTYPAIFFLHKRKTTSLLYHKVKELPESSENLSQLQFLSKDYHLVTGEPWILGKLDLRYVLLHTNQTTSINQWGHFYIGALTGMDEVFVVSPKTITEHQLEIELLYPYAFRGEEVNRYGLISPSKMVVYPYHKGVNGNAVLISERELKTQYPNTYEYLKPFKPKLSQRLDSRKKYAVGSNWFCFLRPGRFDYIIPEKLVIQGVATQTNVGLLKSDTVFNGANTPGFIFDNDLNSSIDLLYLLAILNSRLISKYLKQICPSKLHGYTRFNANNLNETPILEIDFSTTDSLRKNIVTRAKAHIQQTNYAAAIDWTTVELAANRNDTIHDILAVLAEQMITMNKEKQTALEAFWLDLEGITAAKTFAVLREKGKWQQSLHKAVPAARPFVSAESRSSVTLDASLSWNEDAYKGFIKLLVKKVPNLSDLVAVYRKHAPVVADLDQRLTATDNLIDQIVYKLYGLTDEEIAIVEGSA